MPPHTCYSERNTSRTSHELHRSILEEWISSVSLLTVMKMSSFSHRWKGQKRHFNTRTALYVPNLKYNLYLVSVVDKFGFDTTFQTGMCRIMEKSLALQKKLSKIDSTFTAWHNPVDNKAKEVRFFLI